MGAYDKLGRAYTIARPVKEILGTTFLKIVLRIIYKNAFLKTDPRDNQLVGHRGIEPNQEVEAKF